MTSFVRFVRRADGHGDCGIVALAMLANVTYEEALSAVIAEQPAVLQSGLTWGQIQRSAEHLGLRTRLRRKYDIERDTGILRVRDRRSEEHVVFLWAGRVVEGDGELWAIPQAYLDHHKYKAKWLLTVED